MLGDEIYTSYSQNFRIKNLSFQDILTKNILPKIVASRLLDMRYTTHVCLQGMFNLALYILVITFC